MAKTFSEDLRKGIVQKREEGYRALPENIDTLAGLVFRSSQAARREAVLEPCSEG